MSDERSPIEGMMFYRAVCVVCGESPDQDGGEWGATPALAKGVAHDCDWTENEDGTLTCEGCAVSAGSDGEDRP